MRWLLAFMFGCLIGAAVVIAVLWKPADHGEGVAVPPPSLPEPVPGDGAVTGAPPASVPAPVETPDPSPPRADPHTRAPRPAGPPRGELDATPLIPPLRIPVDGVGAEDLADTWGDARGEGREHDAIDIMAARGTPVRAVADGHVEKLFDSVPGGLTIYQFDAAGAVAFYYAHLDRYAEGLVEGATLRQGDVIGYVGSTGNAADDAPHLHFSVFVLGPERHWWEGEAINPYPLLRGGSE
ncbi:M23 family metallopeptidase [Arenimonas composti]|uniref:M23ase beta-sheet core domain-containing protein n=1 Tax=Arenimonas composti TR7-09 = DSM 18010 TaxID=1121013 RepID=A0A091BAT6_9GAMM|nr:peptidoglycan DD-metalloendopeptidase family protein [Arenimonas composti]KFN49783.1 hypothetical protein P873_09515 [Arenimonas composti TR7-09 = DSM 18010]